MLKLTQFTFNAFSENSFVLSDDSNECIIIDPGCSNTSEEKELLQFIEDQDLTPVMLVNTHCHIDHVLGNRFIAEKFKLKLCAHKGEEPVLAMGPTVSNMYGIPYKTSPEIEVYLEEGNKLRFGNSEAAIIFTPGHSPASLSFYFEKEKILIAGDVLFQGSIGRTDLPGGDYNTLIASIREKLLPLGDDVQVYPGHGPSTNIGFERMHNPFLN